MRIVRTSDGICHVRLNSSESKPTGKVNAYDESVRGMISTDLSEGDECFETDTAKVFVMDKTAGWKEV